MPVRGKQHRERDPELWYRNRCLDIKYLGVPGIVNFIDARTQWIDDGMKKALDDGIKQVVIIAAGYDTRAYRLARPGVKFYEIDLPHASQKKRELVEKLLPKEQRRLRRASGLAAGRLAAGPRRRVAPARRSPSQKSPQ
ncbi:hypothetical protein MNEG_16617, partial [Monoraphidium neglectum]